MSTPPGVVQCDVFLQVQPEFRSRYDSAQGRARAYVDKIKVVGYTQTRPTKPKSGVVVVTLTLQLHESAFLPLEPAAVISIPNGLVGGPVIAVTVENPDDNGEAVSEYFAEINRAREQQAP